MEVASIVRSLRALLLHSRSLRANDVALPTEANGDNASVVTLMRTRADFLEAELEALKSGPLLTLRTVLESVLPEAGPITATILTDIDDYLDAIVAVCRDLARYGVPQTGFGVFHEGRAGIFTMLLKKAADLALRWQRQLADYDALILTLPSLVDEAERLAVLLQAEQQVSTAATDTEGLTSAQVLAIVQTKEAAFRARQQAFAKFHETSQTTISGVLTAFKILLPVTDFDSQETNTVAEEQQIVVLAEDILARTQQLTADLEKRIGALHAKLEEHDAVTVPEKRVQLIIEAARAALGDEFVLVPQFTVPERQAAEWTNAYDNRESLLNHQKNALKNDFPVDDWLYGSARVPKSYITSRI
jgi:hypothetical protein